MGRITRVTFNHFPSCSMRNNLTAPVFSRIRMIRPFSNPMILTALAATALVPLAAYAQSRHPAYLHAPQRSEARDSADAHSR